GPGQGRRPREVLTPWRTPMRFTTFSVAALVAVGLARANASAQPDTPLHTEKGLRNQITVEEAVERMHIPDRKNGDKPLGVAGRYEYNRFVFQHLGFLDILHGSQARKLDPHILDDFQCLTAAHPWENIACLGAQCSPTGARPSDTESRRGCGDPVSAPATRGGCRGSRGAERRIGCIRTDQPRRAAYRRSSGRGYASARRPLRP